MSLTLVTAESPNMAKAREHKAPEGVLRDIAYAESAAVKGIVTYTGSFGTGRHRHYEARTKFMVSVSFGPWVLTRFWVVNRNEDGSVSSIQSPETTLDHRNAGPVFHAKRGAPGSKSFEQLLNDEGIVTASLIKVRDQYDAVLEDLDKQRDAVLENIENLGTSLI